MTIARFYTMNATPAQAEALQSALSELVRTLTHIPGFEGADLLRHVDRPDRFFFIERWSSVEAHKEGGALLPRQVFAQVMEHLADKPEAGYLEYLL